MVAPPSDISKIPAATVPSNPTTAPDPDAPKSGNAPVLTAPALDLANIKPLELADALRILIAEIRAAFDAPLLNADQPEGGAPELQLRAAREIVETVLAALPRGEDISAWTAAVPRAEQSLAEGLQRAISIISTWREVPTVVVRDVQDSTKLALSVLSEEMPNPAWLRPEWLNLAPSLRRFARLRRALRRRLTDPDHWPSNFEEPDEHQR
jgi:hypothetical protein